MKQFTEITNFTLVAFIFSFFATAWAGTVQLVSVHYKPTKTAEEKYSVYVENDSWKISNIRTFQQ